MPVSKAQPRRQAANLSHLGLERPRGDQAPCRWQGNAWRDCAQLQCERGDDFEAVTVTTDWLSNREKYALIGLEAKIENAVPFRELETGPMGLDGSEP
jgi:hypothetical protein